MNRRVVALGVIWLLVMAAPAAWARSAPLQDCGGAPAGGGPKHDRQLPIPDIKVRGLTCSAARRAIHAGTLTIHGCFGQPGRCYSTFRTPHFRCKARKTSPVRCDGANDRMFEFWWGE